MGGYPFTPSALGSYKPVNGPIVLGACVSVTFYDSGTEGIMTEMKTLIDTKCA